MSQAERHADLPYNNWRARHERNIVIFANGIDLEAPHNASRGTIYEAQCFRYLVSATPKGRLVFGAGMVDNLFDRSQLRQKIKPDALTFDTVNPQEWILIALHEFKSGKLDNTRKINGFLNLIRFLAKKQKLLRDIVDEALPQGIIRPHSVSVASQNQIQIGFILNTEIEGKRTPKARCRVDFHYLPYEEA